MTDDLQLAGELVRHAGPLADRMLRQGLEVQHKTSITDVVSAADHAAEELSSGPARGPSRRRAGR